MKSCPFRMVFLAFILVLGAACAKDEQSDDRDTQELEQMQDVEEHEQNVLKEYIKTPLDNAAAVNREMDAHSKHLMDALDE